MVTKFKNQLFSENGMKIVNVLFLLSIFLPDPRLLLCTSVVWIAFLGYSLKSTPSKGLKIWYGLLCAFAALLGVFAFSRLFLFG